MKKNDERPHGRALEEELRHELSRVLDREARRLRDALRDATDHVHPTRPASRRDDGARHDDTHDLALGFE